MVHVGENSPVHISIRHLCRLVLREVVELWCRVLRLRVRQLELVEVEGEHAGAGLREVVDVAARRRELVQQGLFVQVVLLVVGAHFLVGVRPVLDDLVGVVLGLREDTLRQGLLRVVWRQHPGPPVEAEARGVQLEVELALFDGASAAAGDVLEAADFVADPHAIRVVPGLVAVGLPRTRCSVLLGHGKHAQVFAGVHLQKLVDGIRGRGVDVLLHDIITLGQSLT